MKNESSSFHHAYLRAYFNFLATLKIETRQKEI